MNLLLVERSPRKSINKARALDFLVLFHHLGLSSLHVLGLVEHWLHRLRLLDVLVVSLVIHLLGGSLDFEYIGIIHRVIAYVHDLLSKEQIQVAKICAVEVLLVLWFSLT